MKLELQENLSRQYNAFGQSAENYSKSSAAKPAESSGELVSSPSEKTIAVKSMMKMKSGSGIIFQLTFERLSRKVVTARMSEIVAQKLCTPSTNTRVRLV